VKQQLSLLNQQRARRVDRRHLCRIIRSLLHEDFELPDYELAVCLVGEAAMIRLNETYLQHAGSTDVITFDYSDRDRSGLFSGEIFICVNEAIKQAPRFRSTWQSELLRYLIHGLLHLSGYDDKQTAARRIMKRKEDQLLRLISVRFSISRIGGHTTAKPRATTEK
jgi:probable rRNA maturation factor